MERLVWFFHNRDVQCLDQAVAVARAQPIDLARLERWSAAEGPAGVEGFRRFRETLGRSD